MLCVGVYANRAHFAKFCLYRTRKDAEAKYRRLRYLKNKYEMLRNSEFFSMDYKGPSCGEDGKDDKKSDTGEKGGEQRKQDKKVTSPSRLYLF